MKHIITYYEFINESNTENPLEVLKDKDILDKIRHFKGSFEDFKEYWDKRLKQPKEDHFLHPEKKTKKRDNWPYQTYGIVKHPKVKD